MNEQYISELTTSQQETMEEVWQLRAELGEATDAAALWEKNLQGIERRWRGQVGITPSS